MSEDFQIDLGLDAVDVGAPPGMPLLEKRRRTRRHRRGVGAGIGVVAVIAGLLNLPSSDTPIEVASTAPASAVSTPVDVEWEWIDNDAMFARDGSTSGYGARQGADTNRLVIYLESGLPCITASMCRSGRVHYDSTTFDEEFLDADLSAAAIFALAAPANPFADWSVAFVPHATGDLHGGTNPTAPVPGLEDPQHMVGANNVEAMLDDLVERFDGVEQVLITGTGAGGLGALINFEQVAEAFPDATVDLLVDSAVIPLSSTLLPDCLVTRLTRGWQRSFPPDWEATLSRDYDQRLAGVYEYLSVKYPASTFGVLGSRGDAQLRALFAFGANQCEGAEDVSADTYAESVRELAVVLDDLANWDAFLIGGEAHGFLTTPAKDVSEDINEANGTAWLQRFVSDR